MKLGSRIARLEGGGDGKGREHVVVRYAGETEAEGLALYGRDRIGPKDKVIDVVLRYGSRNTRTISLSQLGSVQR